MTVAPARVEGVAETFTREAGADPTWVAGPCSSAEAIAAAVVAGTASAVAVAEAALARIAAENPRINAFTQVTAERALREAASVDAARAEGRSLGPLAGVPYAVKDLFDVEGLPTRAGARINQERAPASEDAMLVARMRAAGAVLLGTLHMGEYAYDFTGENAHDGPCRNPHDPGRMSGGSSSGSGAATAAQIVPISLGSDTNGSLRVPASLCGVFSLKPTYGRLGRSGTFPFVDSLDHLGPMARTAGDLARAYDALQGPDARDHGQAQRPPEPVSAVLAEGLDGLRVGCLGGWFAAQATEPARRAVEAVAASCADAASVRSVTLDEAQAGRAAAYLITNAEGSAFHLDRLRARPEDFDPDTRHRFVAGALLPAAWVARAQRVRRWWLERALAAFRDVDLMLAPATPCSAPAIGARSLVLGGAEVPLRPNLGLLAQPFSCIGLPVATVPVFRPGAMPIGVQLVAPPWREDLCLRAAAALEAAGIALAHAPAHSTADGPGEASRADGGRRLASA
jgi:1-carboxybiuret hydrolase